MAFAGGEAARAAFGVLSGETGLSFSLGAAAERLGQNAVRFEPGQLSGLQVGVELQERSTGAPYPRVHLYCVKVKNDRREKFRGFSGSVEMVVEIRVSAERLEMIEPQMSLYQEAVTDVLESHRGCWDSGVSYAGGYEVESGPIRQGGKNFLQVAKVWFQLEVSMN